MFLFILILLLIIMVFVLARMIEKQIDEKRQKKRELYNMEARNSTWKNLGTPLFHDPENPHPQQSYQSVPTQTYQQPSTQIKSYEEKTTYTPYGSVTVSMQFSSRKVEIRQKTPGTLQAASLDSIGGYVSPSGGYINFATYKVTGINPKTNRKNTRTFDEFSEDGAIQCMAAEGFVEPYTVSVVPSKEPSDRQLEYAKDLHATIPPDACALDVSAIISRITDDDERPASDRLMSVANGFGLKLSRYHGEKNIMSMVDSLDASERRLFRETLKR